MAGISNQTGRGIDFALSHTVDRGSGIWRQTALGRSLRYRPRRLSPRHCPPSRSHQSCGSPLPACFSKAACGAPPLARR